jgi:uncharacterized membrane protein
VDVGRLGAVGSDAAPLAVDIAGSESTARPQIPRRRRAATWLPYAVWAIAAVLYSTLSLTRFATLSTPSWDNAIFEQAIRAYAHLQAPVVDIKGPGYNILGDHFSPILAVLAPFYRLFPHAQTLLILQAVLITASIVPIFRIAMLRLGFSGGVAVGIAYALSFGIQSAVYTDFHEVAFAAPLMAFAGEAYLRRRPRLVAVWSLPLLLVKEDLGITLAAIGVVLMIAGARRVGIWLTGVGVGGFLLVLFVVIPAFNSAGSFDYWATVSFGQNGPNAVQTFFTGWDVKTITLLLTFGITGFLALRSPWVLVAGPTLAWRWIGKNPDYWGTNWHYSLILMPVVFVALIDGYGRIHLKAPAWLRSYAAHVPTATVAMALVLCLQFPLASLLKSQTWRPSTDARAAQAVMALIPQGAGVETNMGLITHLATRDHVYWFGTVGTAVPDYVLIDTHTPNDGGDPVEYAQRQHRGHTYRKIFDSGGYLLVQRTK